jgi:hypothetical protein
MSKHLRKFIDLFPSYDLPREKENELIEKTARAVLRMEMDLPALLIVRALVPMGPILAQTALVPVGPLLELVGMHTGYEYVALLNNRDAVQRLADRIEELRTAKEK